MALFSFNDFTNDLYCGVLQLDSTLVERRDCSAFFLNLPVKSLVSPRQQEQLFWHCSLSVATSSKYNSMKEW